MQTPTLRSVARPPIAILGVPLDNVTTAEAIEFIEQMVASREPHYLVTANVDFLVQAREDVELRRILFDAHLVLCDGTPLVWASRLLGNPLPERVAGADLVPLLIRVAARRQYRLFLLGASEESASRAVAKLCATYPELLIVGHYSPPFNQLLEMDHEEIKRRILKAQPDLLFVSFGCPKQEKWIAMHYRALGVPVVAGVGATIDFLAGQVRRAPVWMQRTGTEWIFRLLQEPRRLFRRYVKDLRVFGWHLLVQWWHLQRRRRRPQPPCARAPVQAQPECQWIHLPERLDLAAVQEDVIRLDQVLADGRHCLLDMAQVQFIDSTGIGSLIRLQKRLRLGGCQLVLLAPSPAVQRALKLMHLRDFFALAPDVAAAQTLIEARTRELAALANLPVSAASNGALAWQGEVTAANAEQVWDFTQAHLARLASSRPWRIDLAQVRFIDSTGLGLMVRLKKLAQQTGAPLQFAGLQPAVRNVIHLARLEEFLLAPSGPEDDGGANPAQEHVSQPPPSQAPCNSCNDVTN
ncbi:MAG TPA: WecB/TagA/CpsF family glycosyltransferase [Bacillota bacterium]|nr:WecB/TagA/CpsF family glycosyltransferase [Bacillota bacterium]